MPRPPSACTLLNADALQALVDRDLAARAAAAGVPLPGAVPGRDTGCGRCGSAR